MTDFPVAAKKPITRTFHGHTVHDEYEWLRDKESSETLDYLEQENAYTEAQTKHLEPLRDEIYQEILTRVKQTDMSVPVLLGDYWYYSRIEEGQSYGKSCRVKDTGVGIVDTSTPPEGEEILLDIDEMSKGHDYIALGDNSVTLSGRYLAYSIDFDGDERFDLHVKDLETGELLPDTLTNIYYGATWAGDDYLFYQTVDDAWRPDAVWRHKIGTDQSEDVLVYREEDESFFTSVGWTRSKKYIVIESSSKVTSEIRFLLADEPEGTFEVAWPRQAGVEYSLDHAVIGGEDRFVILHNTTGSNFALGECAVDNRPPLSELNELVAHDDSTRLEGVEIFANQLVLDYRRGGTTRVALMKLKGGYTEFHDIEFEEELYSAGTGINPSFDTSVLRMGYTSFTQPGMVFEYDVETGEKTILKTQEVGGGYNPDDYVATRIWTTARDGAEIPVSLIYRADLDLSTPSPTLLYGYGAYELSIDPGFSISRLSLLDRGMIFAIAHVRGGGEMGRRWYDDGKMANKPNTFKDFIDVADDLVARGFTTPEQIVAEGGSAGGMLMGAIANMAPEKFAGILAIVPFVDSLTSMLMPELPLTVTEWEEWGDPYHDPKFYELMASYSAYENVTAQNYPDILAVTSFNDTRVLYVEPAKWIARLRDRATGGKFLLKTEMVAGHGGISGRYDSWKQTAFEYAWVVATSGARS